jgi:hypothetical protein
MKMLNPHGADLRLPLAIYAGWWVLFLVLVLTV